MKKNMWVIAAVVFTMLPLFSTQSKSVQAVTQQTKQTQDNQPDKSVQTSFTSLITAIEENNYNNFISGGNDAFQEGITKQGFTQISQQLAPRIKKGYSAVFLGELNQQGYKVYLWKLTFKDGGDDFLAKLSLKDGKVGGFWLN